MSRPHGSPDQRCVERQGSERDRLVDGKRDDESRRSLTLRRLSIRSCVKAGALGGPVGEMEGDGMPG
jgi:hypothetical protein